MITYKKAISYFNECNTLDDLKRAVERVKSEGASAYFELKLRQRHYLEIRLTVMGSRIVEEVNLEWYYPRNHFEKTTELHGLDFVEVAKAVQEIVHRLTARNKKKFIAFTRWPNRRGI